MAENANVVEAVAVQVEEKNIKVEKEDVGVGTGACAAVAMVHRHPFLQLNNLDKLLAIFTFLLSIPILGFIVWIFYMKDSDCETILKLPSLQLGIGIGLVFLFVISNGVVFWRSRYPIQGLLLVMVPLLLIFTIGLALVGAYKMESRSVPASPKWFRLKVYDNSHWDNLKSCIFDSGTCDDLVSRTLMLKSYDFNLKKLSPIESGCCKPSTTCEMEYVNATFWMRKDGGVNRSDPYDGDCDIWDNDRGALCYNCLSCKRGFLRTLQTKWYRLGVFLVVVSLLFIISHLLLFLFTVCSQYQS